MFPGNAAIPPERARLARSCLRFSAPCKPPEKRIDRKPLSLWLLHSLEEKSSRLFCGYSTSSPSNAVNVSSSTSHFFRIAKMVFDRKPARSSCRKIRAACF